MRRARTRPLELYCSGHVLCDVLSVLSPGVSPFFYTIARKPPRDQRIQSKDPTGLTSESINIHTTIRIILNVVQVHLSRILLFQEDSHFRGSILLSLMYCPSLDDKRKKKTCLKLKVSEARDLPLMDNGRTNPYAAL